MPFPTLGLQPSTRGPTPGSIPKEEQDEVQRATTHLTLRGTAELSITPIYQITATPSFSASHFSHKLVFGPTRTQEKEFWDNVIPSLNKLITE